MQLPSAGDDPIDPQIRTFVSALAEGWARYPSEAERSIDDTRRIAEELRAPWRAGGPAMASTTELQVPTRRGAVRVRVYRPSADPAPAPALVYLHGGGWTIFSVDTHDRIMRELAQRAGVVVLGVDYALSPEAKYPHALEQVVDVVRWLRAHAAETRLDGRRIAIGGDSAGANLSAAASLVLREAGEGDALRGMLLLYGCFTPESSQQAINGFGAAGNLLTSDEMASFWDNYLARREDASAPFAAPMHARLEGLPPAFLVAAQCDVLCEQSHEFAARLRAAGVAAELREYPGATHSFLEAVSVAAVADRAFSDCAKWLRALLARDGLNATMKDPVA